MAYRPMPSELPKPDSSGNDVKHRTTNNDAVCNVKDMRKNWSAQDFWHYGFHGNRHGFMVL